VGCGHLSTLVALLSAASATMQQQRRIHPMVFIS
jgi:hypothetical protein